MVTLLAHNRDSWCADEVCQEIDWILPIYDAFIIMPWDSLETKVKYASKLDEIYTDREETLEVYFKSINLVKTVGSEKQWKRLQNKIKPLGDFKASSAHLK